MFMRTKLAALVGAATMAASLMAVATPAGATGPCGSGYNKVGDYRIPQSGTQVGTLMVYYNSSSGKNCALTYGYRSTAGTRTHKLVRIGLDGSAPWADTDSGNFASYAGPVYVSARGRCIDLYAEVKSAIRGVSGVHCG
jgi:hypothetical protein